MRYKDDRIDAGLIEILNQAVKAPKSLGENSSYYLVFDAPAAARALAWRDRSEVFRTLMTLLNGEAVGDSDIAEAAARIGSKHAEFRPAMVGWLKDHPRSEAVWRGDFRELAPTLEKMATSSPDELEPDLGKLAPPQRATAHFHHARAILTDWRETDPLTKLKLDAILEASSCCFFRPPEFMYAEYKELPRDQQRLFREFVDWLEKQPTERGSLLTESLDQLFASEKENTVSR